MRRLRQVIILIFVIVWFPLLISFSEVYQSADVKAINKAAKSVLMLEVYDSDNQLISTGSGFVTFDNYTLVTNEHVIKDAELIIGLSDEGNQYMITKVVAADPDRDIAILEFFSPTDLISLPIAEGYNAQRAEPIATIGSPLGLKNSVSLGNISALFDENGVSYIQFTAPISKGSSGGVLLNANSQVIGITTATLVEGQNINLAISIDEVAELYRTSEGRRRDILSEYAKSLTPPSPTNIPIQKATPTITPPEALDETFAPGRLVTFGRYEQDDIRGNGKEPIRWRVLKQEGSTALLISENGLVCMPYYQKWKNTIMSWEESPIRSWLNRNFLSTAFTAEEQRAILLTSIRNEDNPEYGTKGGNDTKDKIFLLSISEAQSLFKSDLDRRMPNTPYTVAQGAFDQNGFGWWWLRSPGYDRNCAACIPSSGYILMGGSAVGVIDGVVRPALVVDLNSEIF